MANSTKRYIATVTFYCYGEDDEKAFAEAEKIVEKIKAKEDNEAEIEQFHFHDFGSMKPVALDIVKLKSEK